MLTPHGPTQVFRDMKVQQSISYCSAESLRSALQAAAAGDAPPSAAHEASARLEELALGTRQTAYAANEALEEFGTTALAAYLQPGLATRDRQTAPAAHDTSERSEKSESAAREKQRASTVHEAPEKSESAADSAAAQSGTAAQHPKQDDSHFAPLMGKEATSGAQRSMPGGKKGCFWCAHCLYTLMLHAHAAQSCGFTASQLKFSCLPFLQGRSNEF